MVLESRVENIEGSWNFAEANCDLPVSQVQVLYMF